MKPLAMNTCKVVPLLKPHLHVRVMIVIYNNLPFAMLAMIAVSLLIFGTIVQNVSATSSEIRMLVDLNPPTSIGGGIAADGRADYRERGNSMRLNVEVEDVLPNSTFTIEISGNTLGTITSNSFGTAELELNTNDGQAVPKILRGDLVQIFQGTGLVLSGNFDDDDAVDDGDGNIENGGSQVPITPNQNSVMQASNSSANLLTVPSSNTTLQDAPVTATNSSSNNNNNLSNAALGSLFMIVEFEIASVNPINETYIETSTVNNVTIMPPNATNGTTINATETVNATINILPNGLALDKGQSLLVTDSSVEQENATTAFVDISRMNPDGTGRGTGVVFFSTNSTGQLAFLDNMVGISQSEFSSEGGTIRTWEWKGETLPLESGGGAPTTGNQAMNTVR
jgi:hypothetical protein